MKTFIVGYAYRTVRNCLVPAKNATEAKQKVRNRSPDVIFLSDGSVEFTPFWSTLTAAEDKPGPKDGRRRKLA